MSSRQRKQKPCGAVKHPDDVQRWQVVVVPIVSRLLTP
jgi:hypothetical protein